MGEVQGGIGLEPVGRAGLLRSLVVHPDARGDGYGTALVRSIERYGRENGIERLYLLTTTATPFFERLGYKQTSRAAVPEAIAETDEFSRLCPDSATCMQKSLIS